MNNEVDHFIIEDIASCNQCARDLQDHVLTPRQLRSVRAWLGWKQHELAKEFELSQTAITDWENGIRTPRRGTVLVVMLAMKRLGFQLDDQGNLVLPP